jgi:sugar lactone lactonase YvrE
MSNATLLIPSPKRRPPVALPSSLLRLDASEPLSLADLAGRAVALAFWSASGACCERLLRELDELQRLLDDGLTVIAIHTPKYPRERSAELARRAVERLGLRFPAFHDPDFRLWQSLGIEAWPTVVILDASAREAARAVGAGQAQRIRAQVEAVLDEALRLDQRRFGPSGCRSTPGVQRERMRFPAGLAVDRDRVFIADTASHRILQCRPDGVVQRVYGQGEPGLMDGAGHEAAFRFPQGLAILGHRLFVADAGNEALRSIDLARGTVETVAGTGRSGQPLTAPVDGRFAALGEPWGLATDGERLFVSMRQWRQICVFQPDTGRLSPYSGEGADEPLPIEEEGRWLEPAGLCFRDGRLFVADADANVIRVVDGAEQPPHRLIGGGPFEWGSDDGEWLAARLQYPLDVAFEAGERKLWIADTYNDAIRIADLRRGTIETLELPLAPDEPCAIDTAGGVVWWLERGLHRLCRFDVRQGLFDDIEVRF